MSGEAEQNQPNPREELSAWESFRVLLGASRAFWLVNQVNFFDGIAYFGILNLLTLFIRRDVGLGDQATGIAVSSFTGAVTLFMFGGGFVADRLGVRRSLTLCLIGLLAGRVLLLLSPQLSSANTAALWTALGIMALATGVLQPTLYAGVKEFTDPRTATIGYSLLYAIMNLGIVVESAVSPLLRELGGGEDSAGGISIVFAALSGVTLLMLLIHLVGFTKQTEIRDKVVATEQRKEDEGQSWLEKLRALPILDPRFLYFIFILLPVRTLFAHQFLTLPDYVIRCFPHEVGARYEWLQGLNPLIIVFCVPLIAAMTRKVDLLKMMIIGTSISAVTTFLLVPGPDLTMLILYIVLFSLGEAVWGSRFFEFVAGLAPAGRVGAYMGLAGIPWFLAKATTGLYSGAMIARFIPESGPQDSGTMWLVYASIACISPIGLVLGRRWVSSQSLGQ